MERKIHHPTDETNSAAVESGRTTVKDPICGMDVDPARAAGLQEHEGKTYYFCAIHCKNHFTADPVKYVGE